MTACPLIRRLNEISKADALLSIDQLRSPDSFTAFASFAHGPLKPALTVRYVIALNMVRSVE